MVLSFDKPNQRPALKSIQLTILLFLLCAATQVFGAGMPDDPGFMDKLLTVYERGKALEGGGLLGAVLGLPLLTMGKLPAAIVVVLLVLLFFMLFTGTTIADVMRGAYRPVKKIGQAYNARVEENRHLREQRQERADSDIPVDGPSAGDRAVSYTHLDVYKRQVRAFSAVFQISKQPLCRMRPAEQ